MKLIPFEDLTPEDFKNWPENPRELTPEEEAEVYRLARESFTEADAQAYLEVDFDDATDFGEFLDEMELLVEKTRADRKQSP